MDLHKSIVGDLIAFEPLEDKEVPWNGVEDPSSSIMVQDILDFHMKFRKIALNPGMKPIIQSVLDFHRKEYVLANIDPPQDANKLECANLMKLRHYVDDVYTKDGPSENMLLEESIVTKGHRIVLKGLPVKRGATKPGKLSINRRFTSYKGEDYEYQFPLYPDTMEMAFLRLLDRFNSLYSESMSKTDPADKLMHVFKSISWFLFEILDLHPFGNGNGRLFRAFCSHFMSPFTPFPSPIYFACREDGIGDHSDCKQPCKDVYEQALVEARKLEKDRHPRKLLTMIIHCQWKTWKAFLSEIQSQIDQS